MAGILLRDTSVGNLMVDITDLSKGVLVDFSMAVLDKDQKTGKQLDHDSTQDIAPYYRAIDLCQDDPLPRSLYRHELESFFYALCYILAYRAKVHEEYPLADCGNGTWEDIKSRKREWLKTSRTSSKPFPDEVSLQDAWIIPLMEIFRKGYDARDNYNPRGVGTKKAGTGFDGETLGGHVTYEAFMRVLNSQ